jgi:RNA polymerase sigma factor (sigma-70 family)
VAADAAQETFLLLARRARSLGHSRHTNLAGWCFVAARNVARNARRAESRRRVREEEVAVAWNDEREQEASALWERVEPCLNDVLGRLRPPDRDALLLRYYEQKSLAEVGAGLGLSEGAAQMRVSRALERLRELLKAVGILAPAALLASLLEQKAAVAAPSDFSDRLLAAAREARAAPASAGPGAWAVPVAALWNPTLYLAAALIGVVLAGGMAWWKSAAVAVAPQVDVSGHAALEQLLEGRWEGDSTDSTGKKTAVRLQVKLASGGTYLIHRYDYPASGGSDQQRWFIEKRTGRLVIEGRDVYRVLRRGATLVLDGTERRNTGMEVVWRPARQTWKRAGDRLTVTFEAGSPLRSRRVLRLTKK